MSDDLKARVVTEIHEMNRVGMTTHAHMLAALELLNAEPDLEVTYPGLKTGEIAELLIDMARVQSPSDFAPR